MAIAMTSAGPESGLRRQRMLVGGEWVESVDGGVITVENPARREPIAEVPRGTAADVDRAVQVAAAAFVRWRTVAPRERGRALLRIADALEGRVEEMARTIATETGNAIRTQARGEARLVGDIFRYFGGLGERAERRDASRWASTS